MTGFAGLARTFRMTMMNRSFVIAKRCRQRLLGKQRRRTIHVPQCLLQQNHQPKDQSPELIRSAQIKAVCGAGASNQTVMQEKHPASDGDLQIVVASEASFSCSLLSRIDCWAGACAPKGFLPPQAAAGGETIVLPAHEGFRTVHFKV